MGLPSCHCRRARSPAADVHKSAVADVRHLSSGLNSPGISSPAGFRHCGGLNWFAGDIKVDRPDAAIESGGWQDRCFVTCWKRATAYRCNMMEPLFPGEASACQGLSGSEVPQHS